MLEVCKSYWDMSERTLVSQGATAFQVILAICLLPGVHELTWVPGMHHLHTVTYRSGEYLKCTAYEGDQEQCFRQQQANKAGECANRVCRKGTCELGCWSSSNCLQQEGTLMVRRCCRE